MKRDRVLLIWYHSTEMETCFELINISLYVCVIYVIIEFPVELVRQLL